MEKFEIKIISKKPKKIWGLLSHKGQISIGEFKESFIMPLNSWTINDYKQQWKEGIERLKNHNNSCLVTTVQNLHSNGMGMMWVLYKVGDDIFIQNHLLNREILKEFGDSQKIKNFTPKMCYGFISSRKTLTEYGTKVSEWSISAKDFFASTEQILRD